MTEKSQDGPKRERQDGPKRPSQAAPGRQSQAGPKREGPERPKRQNRQYVVELEETGGNRGLMYALGTIGGLAIGALVLRGLGLKQALEAERGGEAEPRPEPRREPAAQFRPVGVRRAPRDQEALMGLEDAVLDAFLDDDQLAECGIDVGAISHGIVELSGSVWTRDQARRAIAVARGVDGVETVVNRMEIEDERERLHPRDDFDEGSDMSGEWTGHQSGMGSRRQGDQTDPRQRDDSHAMREDSLEQADRSQFADEGLHSQPRVGDPHDSGEVHNPTNFREDELDNQSPFGKHAVAQGSPDDGPPQAMNADSRVGEGLKPGTELALEAADVPVKPHQH
jgi:hypothetical protein